LISAPSPAGSVESGLGARAERWSVPAILAAYLALQANNLRHRAYVAQDHQFHFANTLRLLDHPGRWFDEDFTNRPLLYWVGGLCLRLAGDRGAFWLPAAVFVLLSAAALWLLHDSSRRMVRSPALRIGLLAGVAFLPATVATCAAYAADTAAMLPFALLGWSLLRSVEAADEREGRAALRIAAAALLLGLFAKFTFLALPLAIGLAAWLLVRRGRLSAARARGLTAACVVLPLLVGAALQLMNRLQTHGNHLTSFIWSGTGELTARELLLPRAADRQLLAAPVYWQPAAGGGYALLQPHRFSYPGLFHLGLFSDVLDLGPHGLDPALGSRPEPQRTLAAWSVAAGLPVSGLTVAALAAFALSLARGGRGLDPGLLLWGLLGAAWYGALILPLPFVRGAYLYGYWLPRLVLPAVWCFALLAVGLLDWAARRHPWLAWVGGVYLLAEAALHACSLWYGPAA
jgi:hypothetical protein